VHSERKSGTLPLYQSARCTCITVGYNTKFAWYNPKPYGSVTLTSYGSHFRSFISDRDRDLDRDHNWNPTKVELISHSKPFECGAIISSAEVWREWSFASIYRLKCCIGREAKWRRFTVVYSPEQSKCEGPYQ
jgi:hypothetical protein